MDFNIFVANFTMMNELYNPEFLKQQAQKSAKANKKFVQKLKARKPKNIDLVFQELHQEVFEEIDCLECANCCRGLGPRILPKDISKAVKTLRCSENEFIDKYLRIDEDRDYVFKTMPCPFLGDDNYCAIYEFHPKACRDYPHTNHPKMLTHLNLALKNTSTCPAVYLVMERLRERTDL
jgi:Fe-S-cluster containining protein